MGAGGEDPALKRSGQDSLPGRPVCRKNGADSGLFREFFRKNVNFFRISDFQLLSLGFNCIIGSELEKCFSLFAHPGSDSFFVRGFGI